MKEYSRKNLHFTQCPNLDSALRPILHSDRIPVPIFTHLPQIDNEDSGSSSDLSQDHQEDSKFQMSGSSLDRPSPFNQLQLNHLVRDLYLLRHSAKLLASRLQEKSLLHPGTSVTFYQKKEEELLKYIIFEDGLIFAMIYITFY